MIKAMRTAITENTDKGIQIRHAGRDDIYSVAAFLHECWQAEYRRIITDDFLDAMSVGERHKGLLGRYDEGTSEFLLMFDGDLLIGASVFGKSFTDGYRDDGEISAIYLHHDYIGKGYGHRLFARVEQALAAKGYAWLVLDLLEGNARALRFYLAHGYVAVDSRKIRLGGIDYPLAVLRKGV